MKVDVAFLNETVNSGNSLIFPTKSSVLTLSPSDNAAYSWSWAAVAGAASSADALAVKPVTLELAEVEESQPTTLAYSSDDTIIIGYAAPSNAIQRIGIAGGSPALERTLCRGTGAIRCASSRILQVASPAETQGSPTPAHHFGSTPLAAGSDAGEVFVLPVTAGSGAAKSITLEGHSLAGAITDVAMVRTTTHDLVIVFAPVDGCVVAYQLTSDSTGKLAWSYKLASGKRPDAAWGDGMPGPASGGVAGKFAVFVKNALLAVPDGQNIALLNIVTGELERNLEGENSSEAPLVQIVTCPNQVYGATLDTEGEILVWNFGTGETLDRFKADCALAMIAWTPNTSVSSGKQAAGAGNELLMLSCDGMLGRWRNPVHPSSKPSPVADVTDVVRKSNIDTLFEDEAKSMDVSGVGADDDVSESLGNVHPLRRRYETDEVRAEKAAARKRKLKGLGSGDFDDADAVTTEGERFTGTLSTARARSGGALAAAMVHPMVSPGASPMGKKKRFLCWNEFGIIVARAEAAATVIDVEMNDSSIGSSFHFNFDEAFELGSISRSCVAFASPHDQQNGLPSSLRVRLLDSWSTSPSWMYALPKPESATLITCGSSFVALASSANLLRIFSTTGTLKATMPLPGAPVALASRDDVLMVVVAAAGLSHLDCHHLEVSMYHVPSSATLMSRSSLVLSPGTVLSWVGFGGLTQVSPAVQDSEGKVYIFTPAFGGSWQMIHFPATAGSDAKAACLWLVRLEGRDMFGVVPPSGSLKGFVPQVAPRPALAAKQCNYAAREDKASQAEAQLAFHKAAADSYKWLSGTTSGVRASLERTLAQYDPDRSSNLTRRYKECTVDIVKLGMRCFTAALSAEQHARALDIVAGLGSEKAVDMAMRIATKNNASQLAERIGVLLVQMRGDGAAADLGAGGSASVGAGMSDRFGLTSGSPQSPSAEPVAPPRAAPGWSKASTLADDDEDGATHATGGGFSEDPVLPASGAPQLPRAKGAAATAAAAASSAPTSAKAEPRKPAARSNPFAKKRRVARPASGVTSKAILANLSKE